MAYNIQNTSNNPVILLGGIVVPVGQTREFTEIGTRELDLQKSGIISIFRDPNSDNNKDDARYVEIINASLDVNSKPPAVGNVLNISAIQDMWMLVSVRVQDMRAWKLKLRRQTRGRPYDYSYDPLQTTYVTCQANELVFADTDFVCLYVRVPKYPSQIIEFEYWTK